MLTKFHPPDGPIILLQLLLVKPAASLDGSRPSTVLTQEEQRAGYQRPNGESPKIRCN